jgi:signal transduction histidine kinase
MKRVFSLLRPEAAGNLAFMATVLASYASLYFAAAGRLPPETQVALVVLGLVFTIMGLPVYEAAERISDRGYYWAAWAYLAVQASVAGLIFYLSRGLGFASLLFFPLAAQAVFALPRRQAVLAYVLLLVGFMVPLAVLSNIQTAVANSFTMLAGLIFVAVFTHKTVLERDARTQVERLAAQLSAANRQLSEYAAQVEELATAKERNRLAREIHDSLGHYLTVINVQLEAARMLLSTNERADADAGRALDALQKAQLLAQEGLTDVRRSVAALRAAPIGQRPLPESLAQLVDESQAGGIVTYFCLLGQPRPLTPQAELTLYRAAQEGLTNLRKHSRASRADLTLDYAADGGVRLVVEDNGVGAPLTETPNAFGLLGLRERVQLLNGQVHLHTAPGQGFRLEVTL